MLKRIFNRKNIKKIGKYFLMLSGILIVLLWWVQAYKGYFAPNVSSSLPHKLYFVSRNKANLKVGDLVGFRIRLDDETLPRRLVKIIAGVAGDVIKIADHKIMVNSHIVGELLARRTNGDILNPIQSGKIPKDNYFVYAPHKHSFDSRYEQIGLIDLSIIDGKAYVVW